MSWMIYGANGYTGELVAREAKRRGLAPMLAGRSADRVARLASDLGLPSRVFALDGDVARHLDGIELVLLCAGPFSATSQPMLDACLAAKAHYLDITGEIAVLEGALARNADARQAGVVVCGGVGFDVIPTDCVAAALKEALPGATTLSLGFDSRSRMSAGTAKTAVEGIALGGRVRSKGAIVEVPLAHHVRKIDFGAGEKWAMAVPWGDVSTAYHTTGIPNIEVFIPASRSAIASTQRMNAVRPLLRSRPAQWLLKMGAGRMKGPDEQARAKLPTYVWGEATDAHGRTKTARVRTENGYSVTVSGSLAVIDHVLHHRPAAGAYTPARLVGPDLVATLPGSGPLIVE